MGIDAAARTRELFTLDPCGYNVFVENFMKKFCLLLSIFFTLSFCYTGWAKSPMVGAWQVEVQGAPYVPHLFLFHADGTMLSTNPGNVQLNPAAPHGGANDSLGMGVWQKLSHSSDTYIGTFYELNAYADNHKPADTLYVNLKIKVQNDTFVGNATGQHGNIIDKVKLVGHRIKINPKPTTAP